jgi:hypothetical protein
MGPLTHLETGVTYHVVSDVERAWTFPQAATASGAGAPGRSVFASAQIVAFYGHPGVPAMGILGAYTPERAADEVLKWARRYDALNGSRGVIPALHLITAVAQADAGLDGTYLGRLDDATIQRYVDVTRARGMVLILDVQVGWADPLAEVQRLRKFLEQPHVHLALDPEYATERYGEAPGLVIGSLDASQVNRVQRYLAEIVRAKRLAPKVLVLHQFLDDMLLDRSSFESVAEVEVTIDMDGFGPDRLKLEKYDIFSLGSAAERAAIKLFFEWDEPLITPERLQRLGSPPDLVIYQ